MSDLVAIDGFAGSGWGVACKALGIDERGIDNMPEVIQTRAANGMETIFEDIWHGLDGRAEVPEHQIQIMSPPCQSFSMAGKGAGRDALFDVLRLIREGAYRRPLELEALTSLAGFDPRTSLVLAPLAYAIAYQPYFIAWEQVPTVLPVWEACAEVLREEGYDVWTGLLNAEQYGVPQTRKRAVLMASMLGAVAPPAPTHSRYYSRTPEKLDPGVEKWVSMAEGLGWGMNARPYPTVATGSTTAGGGTDPAALGGSGARKNVYAERAAGRWVPSGNADNDSATGILRLMADEAAALQTFPTGWGFTKRPAVTVGNAVGRGLIGGQGAKDTVLKAMDDGDWIDSPHGDGSDYAARTRITEAEAGMLQSFPHGFQWRGARSKQFLQIGNAVPPLLGYRVLESLLEGEV